MGSNLDRKADGSAYVTVPFRIPSVLHDHAAQVCRMRRISLDDVVADLLMRFLPAHRPDPGRTRMVARIREVLAERARLSVPLEAVSDDQDLQALGMTSFASVQVLLGLEEAFAVEITDTVLRRHSLASISAIVACLLACQPAAPE